MGRGFTREIEASRIHIEKIIGSGELQGLCMWGRHGGAREKGTLGRESGEPRCQAWPGTWVCKTGRVQSSGGGGDGPPAHPLPAPLGSVHRRVRGSLLREAADAGAAGRARGHQGPQSRLHGETAAGLSE